MKAMGKRRAVRLADPAVCALAGGRLHRLGPEDGRRGARDRHGHERCRPAGLHGEPDEREHRLRENGHHRRQGGLRLPGRGRRPIPGGRHARQLQEVEPGSGGERPGDGDGDGEARGGRPAGGRRGHRRRRRGQRDERRRDPEHAEGSAGDPEPQPLRLRQRDPDARDPAVRGAARDDQRVGRGQLLEPQRVLHRRRGGHGPLAGLVAPAARGGRLRGDRREHGGGHGGRRLQLRRHLQRDLQVGDQPVPRQRVVLLP